VTRWSRTKNDSEVLGHVLQKLPACAADSIFRYIYFGF
jgi:hypothetical protein